MARLTLEIPDDTRRKLKTLAAYFGMSMKDFLITRKDIEAAGDHSGLTKRPRPGIPARGLQKTLRALCLLVAVFLAGFHFLIDAVSVEIHP